MKNTHILHNANNDNIPGELNNFLKDNLLEVNNIITVIKIGGEDHEPLLKGEICFNEFKYSVETISSIKKLKRELAKMLANHILKENKFLVSIPESTYIAESKYGRATEETHYECWKCRSFFKKSYIDNNYITNCPYCNEEL